MATLPIGQRPTGDGEGSQDSWTQLSPRGDSCHSGEWSTVSSHTVSGESPPSATSWDMVARSSFDSPTSSSSHGAQSGGQHSSEDCVAFQIHEDHLGEKTEGDEWYASDCQEVDAVLAHELGFSLAQHRASARLQKGTTLLPRTGSHTPPNSRSVATKLEHGLQKFLHGPSKVRAPRSQWDSDPEPVMSLTTFLDEDVPQFPFAGPMTPHTAAGTCVRA